MVKVYHREGGIECEAYQYAGDVELPMATPGGVILVKKGDIMISAPETHRQAVSPDDFGRHFSSDAPVAEDPDADEPAADEPTAHHRRGRHAKGES
jgi:hypothetical protein